MSFLNNLVKGMVGNVTKNVVTPAVSSMNNSRHFLGNFFQGIGNGLQNWWYKSTGQSHLTSEYQHEEELANTSYQRAAADMEAAGLSKFYGISGASSPSPQSGSGLLATAMALQNLKAGSLAIDEQSYNLKKAKAWGVPTSSVDQFAKYDALAKVLFGKPLTDFSDDGGLLSYLQKFFDGFSDRSPSEPVSDLSPVNDGAYADVSQHVLDTVARLDPKLAHSAPAVLKLDAVNKDVGSASGIDVDFSHGQVPNLNASQFDMDSAILKMYHDSLYDELGNIARGQPVGLDLSSLGSRYASELLKEGIFDKEHTLNIIHSWLSSIMDDLGYSFDSKDKLWYYDHW